MADSTTTLKELKAKMAAFVKERDWEQFHSPKNLSMSISIEAAELMEKFQWCDIEDAKTELANDFQEVKHEIADIMCYLLSFCNLYDIDISEAVTEKLKLNALKYPASEVYGSHKKAEILKKALKKSTTKA
jgi:NTP pyrophosphatase (non-canonical NTP hydrolase)